MDDRNDGRLLSPFPRGGDFTCPLCGKRRSESAAPETIRMLLVEDDPDDVWMMRNLLRDRWESPFDLLHAETLQQVFDLCAEHRFVVILLDLNLPDSRGLDTFLRVHAAAQETPVVVLTGLDDAELAVKAVQCGAEDYLVKGQITDDLLLRSIRYAIERSHHSHIERQLQATSQEFRAAREVQQRLFPARPPEIAGLDIAGALWPAAATAGDYFDYIPMASGRWGVVIGDVSSHGMGPALLMAQMRACLRTLVDVHDDAGEILTHANRVLAADCGGGAYFITTLFLQFDPAAHQACFASAGQCGYLLDPQGRIAVLDSKSIPLGIEPDLQVSQSGPLALSPGQVFVLFTDGVFEAESPTHVPFGIERTLAEINASRHLPAREMISHLYGSLAQFTNLPDQLDDITIVLVKVTA